jgi:rubrerythrin
MDDLNINDLLKDALKSEIKAKEFYEDASEKAQSQAGKKFFKEMADFEQNHYNRVKNVIESLDQGIKIESQETQLDSPSVRSEVEGEFEPNKDEIVNVISLAIEAEKNAQERYRTIAGLLTSE